MVVLVSANFSVRRGRPNYPPVVSNNDWCPITYKTREEAGKSIVLKHDKYSSYLDKMTEWSFYFYIPNEYVTDELYDFYDRTTRPQFIVQLEPYRESRSGRVLAGQFHVEVRRERKRRDRLGQTFREYPESPDYKTGTVVLLPLIDRISPEDALAEILHEEIGLPLERIHKTFTHTQHV